MGVGVEVAVGVEVGSGVSVGVDGDAISNGSLVRLHAKVSKPTVASSKIGRISRTLGRIYLSYMGFYIFTDPWRQTQANKPAMIIAPPKAKTPMQRKTLGR